MTRTVPPMSPLAGVRVLEMGDGVAAGFCGRILAALGAEVIVGSAAPEERFASEGDLASAVRRFLDEGKIARSDLKAAPWSALAQAFDILLVGKLSGAERRRIVADAPHLIVVSFSPFGGVGPSADHPGGELAVQAAGGLLAMLGLPSREPLMLPGRQIAYSSGCLGFSAVMAALAHRDRGPYETRGQVIDVIDVETVAYIEWKGGVYYQAAGQIVPRGRETGPVITPCHDGHLALYYTEADWSKVKALFGHPAALEDARFATRPGRVAAEADLFAIFCDLTRNRDKHDLYHQAQALGIPIGAVETMADLGSSPQYAARNFLAAAPGASDDAARPAMPFTFSGARPGQALALPADGPLKERQSS